LRSFLTVRSNKPARCPIVANDSTALLLSFMGFSYTKITGLLF
jgi:hypothetical protein